MSPRESSGSVAFMSTKENLVQAHFGQAYISPLIPVRDTMASVAGDIKEELLKWQLLMQLIRILHKTLKRA